MTTTNNALAALATAVEAYMAQATYPQGVDWSHQESCCGTCGIDIRYGPNPETAYWEEITVHEPDCAYVLAEQALSTALAQARAALAVDWEISEGYSEI